MGRKDVDETDLTIIDTNTGFRSIGLKGVFEDIGLNSGAYGVKFAQASPEHMADLARAIAGETVCAVDPVKDPVLEEIIRVQAAGVVYGEKNILDEGIRRSKARGVFPDSE